jgi:hypothetical protein
MEVFEDNLYVSTYQTNNIIRLNKFGHGNLMYLMRGLNRASDILIVQENKQAKNSKFLTVSTKIVAEYFVHSRTFTVTEEESRDCTCIQ